MIVAQVKALEFHLKPEYHTVKYAETAKKAEFSEPDDRIVQCTIAASLQEAIELLQVCVQSRLKQFMQAKLDPRDFRMDIWYTPVESSGAFWNNFAHCGGNHPVCPPPTPSTP